MNQRQLQQAQRRLRQLTLNHLPRLNPLEFEQTITNLIVLEHAHLFEIRTSSSTHPQRQLRQRRHRPHLFKHTTHPQPAITSRQASSIPTIQAHKQRHQFRTDVIHGDQTDCLQSHDFRSTEAGHHGVILGHVYQSVLLLIQLHFCRLAYNLHSENVIHQLLRMAEMIVAVMIPKLNFAMPSR